MDLKGIMCLEIGSLETTATTMSNTYSVTKGEVVFHIQQLPFS